MRIISTALVVLALGMSPAFLSANVSANPSDRNPNAPLNVHGAIPNAKALAASLHATYERVRAIEVESTQNKDNASRLPGKKLVQASGDLWKAIRDARELQAMGEPAGYALERNLVGASGTIAHYAMLWGQSRDAQNTKAKAKQQLDKSLPKLQKLAERAKGLLSQGKIEAFATLVEGEGQRLAASLSLFAPKRKPAAQKYLDYFSSGDAEIARFQSQKYANQAGEVLAENIALVDQFEGTAAGVVDQVRQSGTFASFDGQSGDAAAAMVYLVDQWSGASAALMRAHSIRVAFNSGRANFSDSGAVGGFAESGLEPRMDALEEVAIQSVVSLIEAASANVSSENAARMYVEFLSPLSVAQRRMGKNAGKLSNSCREPLSNLARRNPAFAVSVVAYDRAASQSLQWRERFAVDHARNLSKQYVPSTVLLSSKSATPSKPTVKSAIARDITVTRTHLIMDDCLPRLLGKQVSDSSVRRLSSNGRLGVVPYSDGHYSLIALPLEVGEQVADLRTAISVSDAYAPLSLDAAGAISAAEMQEFESVGGVIRNVTLESLLVRFAALPEAASVIQPLGELPELGNDRVPPMKAACWRLDVQPMWAQNRYFVAKAR